PGPRRYRPRIVVSIAGRFPRPAAFPLPFRWVIVGFSTAFWGWGSRCSSALEAVETLDRSNGGPNGIRTRVSALRGPCPGPLDDGAGQSTVSGWGRRARTPITGARTRRPTIRRSPRISATTHD